MNAIRIKRLSLKLDMPVSSIYHLIKTDPTFPRNFHLGVQRVAWDEDEIEKWIESRKQTAGNGTVQGRPKIDVAVSGEVAK